MPCSCAAWGCTNRQPKKAVSGITFHRFPLSKENLLQRWIVALKREDFRPNATSRLCSQHFLADDFDIGGFHRMLKKTAVPSVFNFPAHLQPKTKSRRPLVRTPLKAKQKKIKVHLKASSSHILKAFKHDHGVYCKDQQQELRKVSSALTMARRRVKTAKQKSRRKEGKCRNLKQVIHNLKDKNLIESAANDMLADAFGGLSLSLFKHKLSQAQSNKFGYRYNTEIKKFAVTLHYLSAKAYDYVRPLLGLPHPSTLRCWRASVSCQAGFLEEMLQAAGKLADLNNNTHICSLVVDEMSLRKEVVWCPSTHSYVGHVDYGGGAVSDTVASNALVFMLVGMKGHWKAPIAYFLTDHVNGQDLSNNIRQSILRAAEHGLLVKAVVADGLATNMKAARTLGCNMSPLNPQPFFQHPHTLFAEEKVWFICDPPHMLKLTRNVLADLGSLRNGDGDLISWNYIKHLHDLQKKDSLYLANKLRGKHVSYKNVKIKVAVAAQTMSNSVAVALDHLRDDLHLAAFQNSGPTCQFLKIIDRLFDTLNSKNLCAKGFKAPLKLANRNQWEPFLQYAKTYLLSLTDRNGKPLHATSRGQAVVGFICTIASTLGLAQDLLDSSRFKFLMTYKYSQDHLEMFFSKIRGRGGWNNNPTAEQFRASLRALMLQNSIKASEHANSVCADGQEVPDVQLPILPRSIVRDSQPQPDFSGPEFATAVEQLNSALSFPDCDWRTSCLVYTAGYVCRQIKNKLKCHTCIAALSSEEISSDPRFAFLHRRNNGGLILPSSGIVKILIAAEKAFRICMTDPSNMGSLPYMGRMDLRMEALVLMHMQDKLNTLFPEFNDHFYVCELMEENHISQLVRLITAYFIKMRLFKAGKLHHQRVILAGQCSKRMKLNKLVLFSGQ